MITNVDGTLSLQLKWGSAKAENALYYIYSDAKFSNPIAQTSDTKYTKRNIVPGETYTFGVRAASTSCEDKNGKFVVFEVPEQRPTFNGVMSATPVSQKALYLNWDPSPTTSVVSYEIYYSQDLKHSIGTSLLPGFVVNGLSTNTYYCFTVRARGMYGEEDLNTVSKCATTLAYTVPDFAGLSYVEQIAGAPGMNQLRLVWEKATGNVTGYRIYKATTSKGQNFASPVAAVNAVVSDTAVGPYVDGQNTISAIVDGLTPSTDYYFVVRAFYKDSGVIKSESNFVERSGKTYATVPPPTPPTISSVSPSAGTTLGGTLVTLTGTNFQNSATILIGGLTCSGLSVLTSTQATCTTQAHGAGLVDITWTNPDSGTVTLTQGFEFTSRAAPTIASITPAMGPAVGGQSVTISGTGFASGTAVSIGSQACTSPNIVSSLQMTCVTPAKSSGSYDVKVTNSDTQFASLSNGYTFQGPPDLTSVSPATGSMAGGLSVTLTGSNFKAGATVTIGGNNCTSVSVVSATSITCLTPSASANGTVDVVVTNSDGQMKTLSGGFSYTPAPSVGSVTPSQGGIAGGTSITVSGTGFSGTPSVYLGSTQCSNVQRIDGTTLTCVTPAHAAGVVTVVLQNPDGQVSNALANGFRFQAPPQITSVSPSSGDPAGGTSVTVTGSGFVSGATVKFDTSPCNTPSVSSTTISCTTSSHPEGAATITVTNPDGQIASRSGIFFYSSQAAPTVSSVSPGVGPAGGGTTLTITGTGFDNSSVSIGGTACTSVNVVSATQITCTTSAKTAGSYAIVITNGDLQSGSLANAFTYSSNAAPTITSVSPSGGPLAGGATVLINGTNFVNYPSTPTVSFGSSACTSVTLVNPTRISCKVPASASAGAVTVSLVNGDGQAASLSNGYLYQTGPTIANVSPATGRLSGGTLITLNGTNFLNGSVINLGPISCTSVTLISATQMSCLTGVSSTPQTVSVSVIAPDGQTTSLNNAFAYKDGPKPLGVYPYFSSTGASITITVLGSGFDSSATVTVDGQPCSAPVVSGTNKITCTTPSLSSGAKAVVVTNADNQTGTLPTGFYSGTPSYTQTNLVAGSLGPIGATDGAAAAARFWNPRGITGDANFLYFSDGANHTIRKFDRTSGTLSTLSGTARTTGCFTTTAPVNTPLLWNPTGMTLLGGYLYVTDSTCHQIYKINPSTGAGIFVAGSLSRQTAATDGIGSAARFNTPQGIANDGTYLYVTDTTNQLVRKIDPATQQVTTIAGTTSSTVAEDSSVGTPYGRFMRPEGITYDGTGSLYITDYSAHAVRKVTNLSVIPATVSTPYGSPAGSAAAGCVDATGSSARFNAPIAIHYYSGHLYVSDYGSQIIREIDTGTSGVITLGGVCGGAGYINGTVGTGTPPRFYSPFGIFADAQGILVADYNNHLIRQLSLTFPVVISTAVGLSIPWAGTIDDTTGTNARFLSLSQGVIIGGNYYFSDRGNYLLRKIDGTTGAVTTYSGATSGAAINGPVNLARYNAPIGMATDGVHLYVGEYGNHAIRTVNQYTGDVTTLAGTFGTAGAANGVGTAATFRNPYGMVSDGENLYVADYGNHVIRKIVIATQTVSTFAGVAGSACTVNTGCDGVSNVAKFNTPTGIATDGTNLYVTDYSGHSIRKIELATGNVTTVAGKNVTGGFVNQVGSNARFYNPASIATDGVSLFVAEYSNHAVRVVNISSGLVSTLLGSNLDPSDKDGALATARAWGPLHINFTNGSLFFGNNYSLRSIQ